MNIIVLTRYLSDGDPVSEHIKHLSEYLSSRNHKVNVFAFDDDSDCSIEDVDLRRVDLHFEADSLYNWSMMLNNEIKASVMGLNDVDDVDVIHANDWATVPGAITLSDHLDIPLVVTLHSTENERGFGSKNAELISEMEWKAGFEADKILVTNQDTKNSLLFDLDVPEDKIEILDPYNPGWRERVQKIYVDIIEQKKVAEV